MSISIAVLQETEEISQRLINNSLIKKRKRLMRYLEVKALVEQISEWEIKSVGECGRQDSFIMQPTMGPGTVKLTVEQDYENHYNELWINSQDCINLSWYRINSGAFLAMVKSSLDKANDELGD